MNRFAAILTTTTALACLPVGLSTSVSLAQQDSLEQRLVGTWTLVSSDQVRSDGSSVKQFGVNPKGINVFDANGRFFVMVASADNLQIASNAPNKVNYEEEGGLRVESVAYYGTYTVNEAQKIVFLHLEASTFPNQDGTDRSRTITSLTEDELRFTNPAATIGVEVHQVWERAQLGLQSKP